MSSLRLRAIRKEVPSLHGGPALEILRGIDLDIEPGETVAVVGRSGSGKSTLLAVMGLLDEATTGTYAIDGCDVSELSVRARDRMRSQTFGFIFQRFCLLPQLSALENVEVALAHRGIRSGRTARAKEALAAVGLEGRMSHRPGQLSGGEQQRVALARALSTSPAVILADEPTGALDEATAADVMGLIRQASRTSGTTLVVVTHDPAVAASMDRTIHIASGMVGHVAA